MTSYWLQSIKTLLCIVKPVLRLYNYIYVCSTFTNIKENISIKKAFLCPWALPLSVLRRHLGSVPHLHLPCRLLHPHCSQRQGANELRPQDLGKAFSPQVCRVYETLPCSPTDHSPAFFHVVCRPLVSPHWEFLSWWWVSASSSSTGLQGVGLQQRATRWRFGNGPQWYRTDSTGSSFSLNLANRLPLLAKRCDSV